MSRIADPSTNSTATHPVNTDAQTTAQETKKRRPHQCITIESAVNTGLSIPHPRHITTPPLCPPWCRQDEDAPAWPVGDDYRQHSSPEWIIHSPNRLLLETFDIVAKLDQMDVAGEPGEPVILIGARHYGEGYEHPQVGSLYYTDQITPAAARQLAAALVAMADAAEVTR